MLPAANRLRRSADFTHVLRRGRRAASPTLVVSATPDSGESAPRVGFVVSKSVGNAVVRNRVKRRLRHAVRTDLPQMRGMTLVVRANPPAAGASYARLASDLERCLSRVKD